VVKRGKETLLIDTAEDDAKPFYIEMISDWR
jgi:hypothetical protein